MKKIFALLLALALGLALIGCDLFGTTTATTTTTTTAEDPAVYDIDDAAELLAMVPWKKYRLTADIDLAGAEWVPVGTGTAPYSGTFDGQGHTISNFKITRPNDGYAGFFGYVTGDVAHLRLADVTVDVDANRAFYAGLLAGYLTGNLTDVRVYGQLTVDNSAGSTYAGLLVGFASTPMEELATPAEFTESVLADCQAVGSVTVGTRLFGYVGGLAGKTFNVQLTDCRSEAVLTASAETDRLYVGGLVGHNYGGFLAEHSDEIERDPFLLTSGCSAVSRITATSRGTKASVGGLFGYDSHGHLEDCFASSEITASGAQLSLGGYFGESWKGTILTSVVKSEIEVTASEGQNVAFGGVAGFLETPATADQARYLTQSTLTPSLTGGMAVTETDLDDPTWYATALLWTDNAFIARAIAAFHDSVFPD